MTRSCSVCHTLWVAFFFAGVFPIPLVEAASFHIPDAQEDPVFDVFTKDGASGSRVEVSAGSALRGENNIDSVWDVTDYSKPPRLFKGKSGFAVITGAGWLQVDVGGWKFGAGTGWVDSYAGNADAAQLWIDLHSGYSLKTVYLPRAQYRKISVQWLGLGRRFPVRVGSTLVDVEVDLRQLISNSFEELAVDGFVSGDEFAGSAARLYSDSDLGRSFGHGWCIDAAATLETAKWRTKLCVEGILGRLSWDGLVLDKGYISSPRVFTDADGFLRYIGGDFTGVTSVRSLSGYINPQVKVSFAGRSGTAPVFSASFRRGDKPKLGVGIGWRRTEDCAGYVRYYPCSKVGELGVCTSVLRLRIYSDSWLLRSPKSALAEVSFALR